MFGRFFAFEMGCPDEGAAPGTPIETVAYLNEDGSVTLAPDMNNPDSEFGPDGTPMICECHGLGCNKCKRKKAKIITLTGPRGSMPLMNTRSPLGLPMAPGTVNMVMMTRQAFK